MAGVSPIMRRVMELSDIAWPGTHLAPLKDVLEVRAELEALLPLCTNLQDKDAVVDTLTSLVRVQSGAELREGTWRRPNGTIRHPPQRYRPKKQQG
jgi:hypothetical protein